MITNDCGTRARPFAYYFPKARLAIVGRTGMDRIIRFFAKFSKITEFIVSCVFDRSGNNWLIILKSKKETIIAKQLKFVNGRKRLYP